HEPSPPAWTEYPAKLVLFAARAPRAPPTERPDDDARAGAASPRETATDAAIAVENETRVRKRPPLADLWIERSPNARPRWSSPAAQRTPRLLCDPVLDNQFTATPRC